MKETIVHNRYEHHFEVTESSVRYKYSIDLQHGELITTKIPSEVQKEVKELQEVTHIDNF